MAATSSENAFHKITPSASSSTTLRQRPYDVFINHRGPDVKSKLASPIYHVLDLVGVNAFLDREELDLGNLIPQAIDNAMRSARIHIAIFSKDYAASPWCLAELSFMLETGAPIIPVFYDVEPASLKRGTRGKYAEAFIKHETRYDSETLEKWKCALQEASSRAGYEFKSDGDLGILLKKVVNRVQQELKNEEVPLEVAAYPVGLDDAVQNFEGVIRSAPVHQTAQIVGIVGMGGCGKTTLAKELYNRKFKSFDKCSFLSEVREAALPDLQKKLLEDLVHLRNIPFRDASEVTPILAGRLRSSPHRMLIVLDDVDKVDQLNALLPEKDTSLGSDSLVIVTTRDAGVLRSWDISSVYEMKKLDQRHAKELFCRHAFKGPSPPDAFEDLVKKFVNACDRLPLSLKVIGEMLYRKSDPEYWKSNLEKISTLEKSEIKERLKLSYDALNKEEKDLFLDVACFFVGEKKTLAIAVWDAAKWSGPQSLKNLVNKCLVEVDKQNRIRMHNHLRDLGRQIAIQCSPPRLWNDNRNINVMTCGQQRTLIRGIMAATTQFVACSTYNELPRCSDSYQPPFEECMALLDSPNIIFKRGRYCILLELLVVDGQHFTSDFAELSKDLVWLRWFDFQHTNLPSWLSLTNLRVLELYDTSKLQELWENNAHAQPPEQLREMIITATKGNIFHNFPSIISGLKQLRKLSLISHDGGEFRFTTLPDEFCGLQSLEHLELRHCKELSTLPPCFGNLRKLRHLDLCSCQMLSLPDSFKKLINLEHLDLSGCKKLEPMPDILENMSKLEKLYFSGRPKLEKLPLHIAEKKSLRELYLKKTMLMDVPGNIDQLSKLETLVIGSPLLTGFPTSLGNLSSLTRLKITGCIKLKSLPESVKCLERLEYLSIKSSEGMRALPEGFRQLTNLQYLKIIDCPIAELDLGSGSSSSLGKLKVIHLKGTAVTRLSISQDSCPNLEILQLEQNYSLMELDFGSGSSSSLGKLKVIHLKGSGVTRLSISQDCCPNLETLQLEQNYSLMEFEILPKSVEVDERRGEKRKLMNHNAAQRKRCSGPTKP